jgi:hypothetical protein
MSFRKFLPALAAIAAICPSLSDAGPENAALNVCAKAFAASIASPGSPAPSYRLNYRGGADQSALASYYNRVYTFDLHANDAKTGLPLAHATCAVDTGGTIVSLISAPLEASNPALAARF